jgi:hypothetical protein
MALAGNDPGKVMAAMRQLASHMVRINPKLRGLKLEHEGDHLKVMMRVAGVTRFYIQGDARTLIVKFARRALIPVDGVKLEQVVTEPSGRELYLGEGRTEMTRRPRAVRRADGTPWDHYEWWGEDLVPDAGVGVTEDGDDNGVC